MGWDAVATFSSGAMAVLAASVFGYFQLKILKQQVEIQDLQVRESLFDRRMEVADQVANFLDSIWASGEAPEIDAIQRLNNARHRAKFLFSEATCQHLDEMWSRSFAMRSKKRKIDSMGASEERNAIIDDYYSVDLTWFTDRSQSFHEIFGSDLRLSR